jgi:hypothetical protein
MRFTHSSRFAKTDAFSNPSHQLLSDYCVLSSDPHKFPGSFQEDASLRRRRAYRRGSAGHWIYSHRQRSVDLHGCPESGTRSSDITRV